MAKRKIQATIIFLLMLLGNEAWGQWGSSHGISANFVETDAYETSTTSSYVRYRLSFQKEYSSVYLDFSGYIFANIYDANGDLLQSVNSIGFSGTALTGQIVVLERECNYGFYPNAEYIHFGIVITFITYLLNGTHYVDGSDIYLNVALDRNPIISVANTLAFGNVTSNTITTQNIVIKNTGTAALTISTIGKTGDASFTLDSTAAVTLQANATHDLAVNFKPTTIGNKTGTVTLTHNASGSPTTINLTGTGINPVISVLNSLAFGNVLPNTTSTQNIVIKNTGTAALTISTIAKAGATQFTLGSTAAITLQPNVSHNLAVNFKPVAYANYTGTVTLTHNASGSPTAIALSGTGAIPIITNTNIIQQKQIIMGDK